MLSIYIVEMTLMKKVTNSKFLYHNVGPVIRRLRQLSGGREVEWHHEGVKVMRSHLLRL